MQIAEYAFFLRDFPLALSYYRSAASEFKSDKAWRHYAHAQEMAALCLHLNGGSRQRKTRIPNELDLTDFASPHPLQTCP